MPAMTVLASGFGAGKKQFVPDMPNLLRVIIGETPTRNAPTRRRRPSPCWKPTWTTRTRKTFELLMDALLRRRGAGRLLHADPDEEEPPRRRSITVLCAPAGRGDAGRRPVPRDRHVRPARPHQQRATRWTRTWRTVATPYGDVRLKTGQLARARP